MEKGGSVIFLKEWEPMITNLEPDDQIYFWRLFMSYEYEKEQACENKTVLGIWGFIKSQMDKMNRKYNENIIERNRRNGAKGGRPKKSDSVNRETQTSPNNPVGLSRTQITLNNNSNNNSNNTAEVEHTSEGDEIQNNIDDAILEMKNNTQWKTAMCKQTGVGSLEDGDRWIDLFKDHTVASGTTIFKLKDLQQHCFNWVRKRIEAGAKLPIPKEEHKPWKVNLSNMQFH